MREQVEALEHDADVAAQRVEVDAGAADAVVVQADLAALDRLQAVDAAQQRGLAAARGADQADDLVRLDVEAEALEHLEGAVALVDVLDLDQGHQPPRVRRWSRSMQPVDEARLRDGDQHEQEGDRGHRGQVEVVAGDDLGLVEGVDGADHVDQGRVLLQRDEVVEQRRDDPAHRLRHDDEAQGLEEGEAERAGGGDLAPVHALDAGAVDLGDIGAVGQGERQDRVPFGRPVAEQRQAGQRQAEADQIDADDRRQAAEDVGVDGGHQPDRLAGLAGDQPGDGDDQAPDQHEDLGDDEDVDVEPERLEDQPERLPDQRQVEEGAGDRAVVGDHEHGGDHHEQRRRGVADGDAGRGSRRRRSRPAR